MLRPSCVRRALCVAVVTAVAPSALPSDFRFHLQFGVVKRRPMSRRSFGEKEHYFLHCIGDEYDITRQIASKDPSNIFTFNTRLIEK